jgi:4-aminobutyrate aminotransferase/(S)-3-amino-2-methylpropionate transaminase
MAFESFAEARAFDAGREPEVDEHETEALRDIDRRYLSWGDTVHYQERPLIVTGAEGELVFDKEGHRYIDTQMWHSSCNFGYRNAEIDLAVYEQMRRLPQVSGDFLHEEKLLVAKAVADAIYDRTGVRGRVSFNVGGALVVEDALKIVRKNTRRNKVAVFMGGYHGRSLGTLSLSSSHRYREPFNEFADRSPMFPYANCASCFYEKEKESCELYCAKMINKAFSNDFYGLATDESCEIGAMVFELCQGRGYTIPPRDFFAEIVPELRKRNILIVDDEIQIGMFRTGKLFAFEHFGVVPDVITLSKSFTNGLSPLSLVWAREDLVDTRTFGPGHTHSNFANHSLGTAAALATWKYMMRQGYEASIPEKGAYYLSKLKKLAARYPFIHSVDGLGLLLNIVFADASGKPLKNLAKTAVTLAQDEDYSHGGETFRMILNSGGYSSNVLKLAPCLDVTYPEIDRTVAILDQVMARLACSVPTVAAR